MGSSQTLVTTVSRSAHDRAVFSSDRRNGFVEQHEWSNGTRPDGVAQAKRHDESESRVLALQDVTVWVRVSSSSFLDRRGVDRFDSDIRSIARWNFHPAPQVPG